MTRCCPQKAHHLTLPTTQHTPQHQHTHKHAQPKTPQRRQGRTRACANPRAHALGHLECSHHALAGRHCCAVVQARRSRHRCQSQCQDPCPCQCQYQCRRQPRPRIQDRPPSAVGRPAPRLARVVAAARPGPGDGHCRLPHGPCEHPARGLGRGQAAGGPRVAGGCRAHACPPQRARGCRRREAQVDRRPARGHQSVRPGPRRRQPVLGVAQGQGPHAARLQAHAVAHRHVVRVCPHLAPRGRLCPPRLDQPPQAPGGRAGSGDCRAAPGARRAAPTREHGRPPQGCAPPVRRGRGQRADPQRAGGCHRDERAQGRVPPHRTQDGACECDARRSVAGHQGEAEGASPRGRLIRPLDCLPVSLSLSLSVCGPTPVYPLPSVHVSVELL